jgi:hypothetical protein
MQHIVTIRMFGGGQRGSHSWTGIGSNCVDAMRRASAQMPEHARKAWWKAEPIDDTGGRLVHANIGFTLKEKHQPA